MLLYNCKREREFPSRKGEKEMKKSYDEQYEDSRRIEQKSAEKRGMTVEEFRESQAIANRVKTYKAKIARLEKAIAEMKQYVEEHEQ